MYRTNVALQVVFVFLLTTGLICASTKHHFSHTHPIDILIHKASVIHDQFLEQASASKTLADAVLEYRARYHQHPPP